MRSAARICVVMCIALLACWGCAGSKEPLKPIPATFNSLKPAKGLTKKIAVLLTHTPPSPVGRQIGDRYLKSLVDALRSGGPRIQLVTGQDAGWPDDLGGLIQGLLSSGDALEVAKKFRLAGFNGWACARVENLWPRSPVFCGFAKTAFGSTWKSALRCTTRSPAPKSWIGWWKPPPKSAKTITSPSKTDRIWR